MINKHIISLAVGVISGFVAVVITWVVLDSSSPYSRYFYITDTIPTVWRLLNLPAALVILMTRINYRPFALSLFFLQWFLIGIFVVWVVRRFRKH